MPRFFSSHRSVASSSTGRKQAFGPTLRHSDPQTPIFTRQVTEQLKDEDYRLLQVHLVQHLDAGAIIQGSGGLRRFRWRLRGRGKRGGARIIYYWKAARGRLYLLFLYPKNVRSDLTPAQQRVLRELVSGE